MSFLYDLYDEAIYSELLKNTLKKTAQDTSAPPDLPPFQDTPATPSVTKPQSIVSKPQLNPNSVAKKLVNRLSREMSGSQEILNISSESPTPVDLGVNQLQNLGKLLQFMSTNKIKLDGVRIVFTEAEMNTLPETEKNQLSPISVNMSRDAVSRKWNTADFYTHLPLLIKYVSYLQDKAQNLKKGGDVQGRILEVMIGKLIDSVNSIKPDSGLSRLPKSQPNKPNEMADNTQLDSFGTKVFDINNPFSDKGSIPLFSKDLSSKEALNAWMRQGPEAQILLGTGSVKYTDPEANHCNIINVLYKRAFNLSRTSASAEETKKYNFYLEKITQLGPTFTDPQGKACSIGSGVGAGGVNNRHNFFGPGSSGGEQGGGATTISPQIIEQIIQSLPLDVQDIDFNRIKNFFTLYSKVASRDNVQSALMSMATAMNIMSETSALTLTGFQQTFRITRNVQELMTWLKPPAGNNAKTFLYNLQQIIVETGKIIGMFYNEFARTLYSGDRQTLNGEQKALVEAQYLGGNSIYSQNLRDIQSLMANFQHALGAQK